MSEVLAHVFRGDEIESTHRGSLAVVDENGIILYSVGDPYSFAYLRSAAKPFQVVPMVEAGGIERFGFNDEEIAIMTSSHGGEEKHVETVKRIFDKMGCDIEALDCGVAAPLYSTEARRILKSGREFQQLHNPCSGKHSCMIALAILKGYEIQGYVRPNHPVQQEMLDVICDMTELCKEEIKIGIDGCGVPVFGLPIYNMAKAYSKLAKPEGVNPGSRGEALKIIGRAMSQNPYLVAGTGRLDTLLMETTGGRLIAKLGMEGVYCIGVIGKGIGITVKIEDGHYRAVDPVAVELLRRLDLITPDEFEQLKDSWLVKIKNHRGDVVGDIKAVF